MWRRTRATHSWKGLIALLVFWALIFALTILMWS